jgi:hypothetical protein
MRFLFAVAALGLWASNVHAGTIYKCKAADGSVTHQQVPCTGEADQVGARKVSASESGELRVQQRIIPAGPAPTREEFIEYQQRGETPPAQTAAYQCDDGRREWIQRTPCPSRVKRYAPVSGVAISTTTGEPMHVTGAMQYETGVQQQGLSKRDVCEELKARPNTTQKRGSAGQSAYLRNKMRDENGC